MKNRTSITVLGALLILVPLGGSAKANETTACRLTYGLSGWSAI